MKLSYDDGYLVTVGHDGMICVYEFRKDPTINLHTMPYAEELLMSREKYFRKKKKIDEISSKVITFLFQPIIIIDCCFRQKK